MQQALGKTSPDWNRTFAKMSAQVQTVTLISSPSDSSQTVLKRTQCLSHPLAKPYPLIWKTEGLGPFNSKPTQQPFFLCSHLLGTGLGMWVRHSQRLHSSSFQAVFILFSPHTHMQRGKIIIIHYCLYYLSAPPFNSASHGRGTTACSSPL